VGVGRRADDEGVDVRRRDNGVDLADFGAGRIGQGARRLRARVGDDRELRPRMRGDVAAVDAPDAACAEKADPEFALAHALALINRLGREQRRKRRCQRRAIGDLVAGRLE
jgi:hypothetical protein